jgi:hypothetical protein
MFNVSWFGMVWGKTHMAQTKRELEISLHGIRVPVTGTSAERETAYLLTAELV